ncbi:multidrug ABC transporter ATP-binding protein [Candidatus Dojkabacteria bacterium CG_4_9_14_3_um_filter_150_Dojkabacteria_WS6_41_13]|uniref:Multidrug ABC transporter ATP-binding protein n=1 Tax=Candidatus Dojkabacteria bacterium CG_4_10_14_0_2_um_filter_Dojkabacteria_WS6_41_15 TaxID=2014249 RepID=A0A2M7W2N3_9BACT|nr:MAG: multidrug ABC transporter ATP-binding protein [Candidatus Dojkabacteria bacterium CG_4_10_14_0_2_um_filter_Dojkabacteria_WS6_41_15]PJB22805.1 MAG: multidrug ABC transporter ATP-binding protein [Candidatus Dojkabacteria bacterium CG_4_9_14_3_um_filter_150_Dojkabacteria_WS6_41_13]
MNKTDSNNRIGAAVGASSAAAPRTAPAGSPRGGMGGPMGGPPGMLRGGEKAKNFKATMVGLANYLRPYWIKIVVVIVFAIASTVFAIVSPKIMGKMTDQLVTDVVNQMAYDQIISKLPTGMTIPAGTTGADLIKFAPPALVQQIPAAKLEQIISLDMSHRPEIDWKALDAIALTLVGLFLLSAGFSYLQGWIMTDVTQKVTYNMRKEISEKINRIPLKYFDTRTFGDVLSRVTNDVDTISQSLNQSLTQIITSIVTILGILIMMLSISWQMTLVALIALPLSFGIIALIVNKSQRYFKSQQEVLGKINGHIEEMYAGHTIVKVFNGERRSLDIFDTTNTALYANAWKSQFFSSLMWPIMNFIGNLDYVGVAIVGGYLAVNKSVTIGDISAFIQYVRQFNQPIIQTANIANVLQSTAAAAERVFEFLAESEEVAETETPVQLAQVKGNVEFDHVVFGYEPDTKVIKDFTATIKQGQRVAIVGPTGAGKTTMVNLLMRFYDVSAGAIRIDGIDIREFSRGDFRRLFGMVLQDTWLFNGTIRENLLYGKHDATESEVEEVARAAHVDHFVHSLPNGYDMVINEEADNISQGEKQLLTIARAMIANPPMLILDEATSNVDTRTEVLIQHAMEKLMQGRTSFVIAHRLSTIRDADVILVMRDGNIVEQGTHVELLALNGFYANLYSSQFTDVDLVELG